MRPGGFLSRAAVKRAQEAASSWLLLNEIWQQFGPSSDGAVERDIRAAEERLKTAVSDLDFIS